MWITSLRGSQSILRVNIGPKKSLFEAVEGAVCDHEAVNFPPSVLAQAMIPPPGSLSMP